MAQIIQVKRGINGLRRLMGSSDQKVVAALSAFGSYFNARKEAEILAQEHGLRVADLPLAITVMDLNLEIRKAIRSNGVDTLTVECHGMRRGSERCYETWHSIGSLATVDGLVDAFEYHTRMDGFVRLPDDEWRAVGPGREFARVHIDDVKRGDVPKEGDPYACFVRLDKDHPAICSSGRLSYDDWMKDDIVLLRCGSPSCREKLADILFKSPREGGEGWTAVGSHHQIYDVDFVTPKGRLVCLFNGNHGLGGSISHWRNWCFSGVGDRATLEGRAGGELSLYEGSAGELSFPHGAGLSFEERAS